MKRLALSLAVVFTLSACNKPAPEATAPPMAETPPPAASDQPEQMTPPASTADMFATRIDGVLAGSWRSDENKARDAYRHPKDTLAFFGVNPTQTIIEIAPGGGWYTEILAPLMKGSGSYHAAFAADAGSDYNKRNNEAFRQKLSGDAERYSEARMVEFDPKAPSFGAPGSADMVLTFRNVHNWVGGDSAEAMFKGFFDVLKPGGVLGVVEHRAIDGADLEAIKKSGYLPTAFVAKLATDAGFQMVDSSEINANANDTKDYADGVWTLPPSYRLKDVDRDKYAAIGESDRMTLKFVKPAGDAIFQPKEEPAEQAPAAEMDGNGQPSKQ
ncbi:MAG: methyltransferase [Dokdonella sp.]